MKKTTQWIVTGLGLAQLVLAGKTKAQEVQSLNEVVISTTKNDQKQSQTGKVVSVITREELDRSAGRNLAELLNQQAGINIVGAGSSYSKEKSIFFRGAASSYTVILIDGVLASDPSSIAGAFDLRMLAIDQIDHIEILRGGQSTIYGSDAVAGVINIITKKSGTPGNNVYGVASAGSYNSYKGTLGLSSKVDAVTYNVSYSHFRTDGISEAANPAGNTQVFDKDGVRQDAVNANFNIQLDKRLTINPFLRYFAGKFDYDADAFTDANNKSVSKHFNGGLNAQYQLNKGKITLNYSHENTSSEYISTFGGRYNGRMDWLDLFYNQNLGEKVNVLVGLDNRATGVTYYGATLTKPSTNLFSTYASVFLHDLSVFNLEVGGRYNKHNKYGENYTYAVTPSINIIKEVKVFGTVSSAFRAPLLDMLFGQYGANLNLKPEKATNYEAGASFNFLNEKINLRAVAFKRKITDAINYTTGYVNLDRQDAKGFEIEPSVKFNRFTVKGYYAYVEGKLIDGKKVADVLVRRPKNTYGINAGVQATDNLYFSANYKFTGKRTDDFFDNNTFTTVNMPLASYKLLDFYAEYALAKKRIKIFADLKNLTDEKYTEIIGYNTMGFNMNAGVSFNFR